VASKLTWFATRRQLPANSQAVAPALELPLQQYETRPEFSGRPTKYRTEVSLDPRQPPVDLPPAHLFTLSTVTHFSTLPE